MLLANSSPLAIRHDKQAALNLWFKNERYTQCVHTFRRYSTNALIIYSNNKKRKRFAQKLRDFMPARYRIGAVRVDRRVLIAGK